MDKWFLDPKSELLKSASTDKFVWFFYEKVLTEKSVTGIKLPLVRIFRTKHTLAKIKTVCANVPNNKAHKHYQNES